MFRDGETGMIKRAIALAMGVLVLLGTPAGAAADTMPAKKERGYITLPDGVQLRYSVWLPAGDGPFPTLMQYEGYQAGSNPARATHKEFIPDMLDKGYAVFGVSARGSACSSGKWEIFSEQQARDGAFALEWAARQPWSTGRVGLYGYSYGGIMQLWVASMRPQGLVATAPGNTVADTYRDIAYPGGVPNILFPSEWGVALQTDWVLAGAQAAQEGDATCLANWPLNHAKTDRVAEELLSHPFDGEWHHDHSAQNFTPNINVPVLGMRTWQDEETGGRQADYWSELDPRRTWLVNSNGNHLVYQSSKHFVPMLEGFFDRFVKGEANGFQRTPRVQIWHETGLDSDPRSVTTQPRLPVKVTKTELFLGADGVLTNGAAGADGASTYQYPVPSPIVTDTSSQGLQQDFNANTWSLAPHLGAGRAVFTTPPLAETLTTYGPSSADLYVSTTAPDVDLQVTVTEVRPDGQELYVQRGWLRASHRALDATRSTAYAPYGLHTEASLADMPAGEPELLRVPVFPFGQAFRAGSSLRIYVEQPSVTGLWGFDSISTSQNVSIHYGPGTPSKLVLGRLADANVEPELPKCGELLNQPCRPNPIPQPEGSLDLSGRRAQLVARVRAHRARVRISLRARGGSVRPVTVLLRRGGRTVARTKPFGVGRKPRRLVLGRRLAPGTYVVVIRSRGATLLRRGVKVGRASA